MKAGTTFYLPKAEFADANGRRMVLFRYWVTSYNGPVRFFILLCSLLSECANSSIAAALSISTTAHQFV